jgi:hypothetical protein
MIENQNFNEEIEPRENILLLNKNSNEINTNQTMMQNIRDIK